MSNRLFVLAAAALLWVPEAQADSATELSLNLALSRSTVKPGDTIEFAETLRNVGKQRLQIYDDTCFHGSNIFVERISDGKKDFEVTQSSAHTVKPGMRPSKRVWLEPGQTYRRTYSAFITSDYSLAFQQHSGSAFTGYSSGENGRTDLPEKFIGCGSITKLGEPGKYKVEARYRNDTQWSNGETMPAEPAWIGRATSPAVLLEIKSR